MPPSCESSMPPLHEHQGVPVASAPTKNVTFAVNYEVQMVNAFLASPKRGGAHGVTVVRGQDSLSVLKATGVSTAGDPSKQTTTANSSENNHHQHRRRASNMENDAPNLKDDNTRTRSLLNPMGAIKEVTSTTTTTTTCTMIQSPLLLQNAAGASLSQHDSNNNSTTRRSAREKPKKEVPLARCRVRYDMQLVPPVKRQRSFLQNFAAWWENKESSSSSSHGGDAPRRSSRLTCTPITDDTTNPLAMNEPCQKCEAQQQNQQPQPQHHPFEQDTSVVWVPSKRTEWEDTVSEMTAVCTSAALRKYLQSSSQAKPFYAPLSRDYIRDRVDIDDPLQGFQIRHKTGGWLQGFILWTNFTTWTHYYRWDSLHAESGILNDAIDTTNTDKVDADGSLAAELEAQPRAGDPQEGGIVFEGVAEISLVGGLGCGEYALRMALDDILEKGTYKYVVLQATDSSKTFYERFGFIRVGAVCRYLAGTQEAPVMGYRHWTHANESKSSLNLHGGPSYMMCLKLPESAVVDNGCSSCGRSLAERNLPTFLQEMLALAVDQKPTIEQLGATSTPGSKSGRRNGAVNTLTGELLFASGGKRKYGRRTSGIGVRRKSHGANSHSPVPASATTTFTDTPSFAATATTKPSPLATNIKLEPPTKKRKLDGKMEAFPNKKHLLTPPPDGKMTYNQKQYQSVWLAVQPDAGTKASRAAPKDRSTGTSQSEAILAIPSAKKKSVKKKAPSNKTAADGAKKSSTPKKAGGKSTKRAFKTASNGPLSNASTESLSSPTSETKSPVSRGIQAQPEASDKPVAIDKKELRKQKVKSYPRIRVHFFNRVVKLKHGTADKYYFVLHYSDAQQRVRMIPMVVKGKLSGKREGRPRYQAIVEATDSNFLSVAVSEIQLVKSVMVMKTPIVAEEAWDVV